MFTRLAETAIRARRPILLATLGVAIASVVVGGSIAERLTEGGFDDPSSDSVRAEAELEERFGAGAADVVVQVTVNEGVASVDDPEAVAAGVELTREIAAQEGTASVVSYWTLEDESLRSATADRALVLVFVPGASSDPARQAVIDDLAASYSARDRGPIRVDVGGREAVFARMGDVIEDDLASAEAIAIPLTFLVLVVVFGGIVAAGLPVGVGLFAVLGTFVVLRVADAFTDVSIFALNLVTALGLGLAVDYSLLVVSRYREERRRLGDDHAALVRTVETAGRTIAFSALTVAISLAALLIFPLSFLRSFAYAGIGVVVFAMAASLVVLPAALAGLGPRIDSWTLRRRPADRPGTGAWWRIGRATTARPWPVIAVMVPLLALTAIPFLGVEWGEALRADDPVRAVSDILRHEFETTEANAFPVVALDTEPADGVTPFAIALSRLDGVARVDAATGSFANGSAITPPGPQSARFLTDDATWFNVVPSVEPISAAGEALVAEARALDSPFTETWVGGGTAALVDTEAAITQRAWLAGLWIVGATFVLLFAMFRSVLVPIKAIVLNVLSLGATFGLMVWVFQDGHGAGLLGITATGQTDITTPILMLCIAFGLSMDYEVFLLARIKEEYDRTGDNRGSIITGLAGTGRLVTSAALVLSITFVSFGLTANVSTVTLFGLGLAVAVLVDAFVVRVTLVPALMTVTGRANWWAPALRRASRRPLDEEIDLRRPIDLRDHDETAAARHDRAASRS